MRRVYVLLSVSISIETGFGTVCERFAVQFKQTGYVLKNFQPGWQIVEEIDGANKTEEELLATLADAVREWDAEIAEISGAMRGQHFGEETIEAMHVELEAELERPVVVVVQPSIDLDNSCACPTESPVVASTPVSRRSVFRSIA